MEPPNEPSAVVFGDGSSRRLAVLLFVTLLTKVNHLETKFDANSNLLVGKLMELDRRLFEVEATRGL